MSIPCYISVTDFRVKSTSVVSGNGAKRDYVPLEFIPSLKRDRCPRSILLSLFKKVTKENHKRS